MSETKAKLAIQVEELKRKVRALQDVAQAADNLIWDMGEDSLTHCPALLHELQAALSAARFAR